MESDLRTGRKQFAEMRKRDSAEREIKRFDGLEVHDKPRRETQIEHALMPKPTMGCGFKASSLGPRPEGAKRRARRPTRWIMPFFHASTVYAF